MEYTLAGFLLVCILATCRSECVDDKKTELRVCFDQLKTDLATQKPKDFLEFMCSTTQKERLNCIIKHFKECPDFETESFLDELQHSGENFHAKDLFYIKSADEFCKCAPTLTCFEDIEVDQLYTQTDRSPWSKIANPSYVCGIGRTYINCVADALPTCTRYLQYKYNESMEGVTNADYFDVSTLQYAGVFAENRCGGWPDDANSHNCTYKRSNRQSLDSCYADAENLVDEKDRMCGMRKCIVIEMSTCPKGDMDYFIDSVNVFAQYKIETEPCKLSSASVTMATLFSVLLSICIALLL